MNQLEQQTFCAGKLRLGKDLVLSQVVCLDNDQLQLKPDGCPFTYRVSELASYYVVGTIMGTSNIGVTIVTIPSTLDDFHQL